MSRLDRTVATDLITDHSVGRDVNSSSVLSVLVRRGQRAAGLGSAQVIIAAIDQVLR
jgi:hypothetical protein